MQLSSKSLWFRFAYFDFLNRSKPTEISFCGLIARTLSMLLLCAMGLCFVVLVLSLFTAVTPIAFVFGYRPCFIKFIKDPKENASPFQRYRLPEVWGFEVWPIAYIGMIVLSYTLSKHASLEIHFLGTKLFLIEVVLIVIGCIGLIRIILENIPYDRFSIPPNLKKIIAWFQAIKEMVCPTIEIID